MQKGSISDAAAPYLPAREMSQEKFEEYKDDAWEFCNLLGKYRMPFAWTPINLFQLLAHQVTMDKPAILIMPYIDFVFGLKGRAFSTHTC